MAKGSEAKENLINNIKTSLGDDFIGEYDKKYYFWSIENGEKVQVSISLTCPKNWVGVQKVDTSNEINFEDEAPGVVAPEIFEPTEITPEEENKIAELLAKLGL